jgi:predicted metal-dependent hydrolase
MIEQLNLGEISVDVVFKDIKNVHLSVYPPTGRVRISAPRRMKLSTIRVYAISKLDWIKRQQLKLQAQERETPREYLNRESHYLWGKRYLLEVVPADAGPEVELSHNKMLLKVRSATHEDKKGDAVAEFYRKQIKAVAPMLIEKWGRTMDVNVAKLHVQQMKTKWGSCNPRSRAIRLNTELAKKPKHCLEYIVVHELVHFFEPHHGARFVSFMDKLMPHWRHYKNELNRHPLAHQDWNY